MSTKNRPQTEKKQFLEKFLLPGKVALVTGAARGIGKAIALALAEAGADVVVDDRKIQDLDEVTKQISQIGRRALPVEANIRHLPEIDKLVKEAMDEFGHIDILVNNAGANPVFGSVFDIDEGAWDVTLGVNLKGCFFLSQAVGKIMREQGGGTIVNTASISGMRSDAGTAAYNIGKAGVIMLTQVLAQEWGQYNIRVNAIAPGRIKTRLSEAFWGNPEISKDYVGGIALGRWGEPEEMATAVLFLASEASSYVTGQTLVLDGGMFISLRTQLAAIKQFSPK